MSILDQVVEAGVSERSNSMPTDKAIEQFGHALTNNVESKEGYVLRGTPFRGFLRDVRGTTDGELLTRSGLAWKVHSKPVAVLGQMTVAKGYQALVRGDTTELLSIVSDQFKAHQNSEIIERQQQMAAVGQAEIIYAGCLDGGRKVVAVAKLEGEFELPDQRGKSRQHERTYWNDHSGTQTDADKTALFVVISGGHEVGTPFKIRGMAFRRWCANGAFFTVDSESTYTCTHRVPLSNVKDKIAACYESIKREFCKYGSSATRLQQTAAEKEQMRLYVAELLKPGLANELGERLKKLPSSAALTEQQVWMEVADGLRGKQMLDKLLIENEEEKGFARTGKHLLEAIVEQDGANGANLWSAYNGITWYVDHKRGRNDESGVDAALFGAGANLKEQALATAMKFAIN